MASANISTRRGTIQCSGFAFPKAVLRKWHHLIERSLEPRISPEEEGYFQLTLEREGSTKHCSADFVLRIGGQELHARHLGNDTQEALSRSLHDVVNRLRTAPSH